MTGTEPQRKADRILVGRCIRPLLATKDDEGCRRSPEHMLHRFLHSLSDAGLDPEDAQLLGLAKDVVNFPGRHGFIDRIIESTGEQRSVALSRIVKLASRAEGWGNYTKIVRKWLAARKSAHRL